MPALLLRLIGHLPLRFLHAVGSVVGRLVFGLSGRYRARIQENLALSGVARDPMALAQLQREVASELGKGLAEIPWIWFRRAEYVDARFIETRGWDCVEAAQKAGRGMVFLTPHLGAFEMAGLYVAMRIPLTALYRPPKIGWLEPIMRAHRLGGKGRLVPTTMGGVRQLLKALKQGEAIGVLPDQVPGFGEGVWVPFFNRPAYTMTLIGRLQRATNAAIFVMMAERLPRARGFRFVVEPLDRNLEGEAGSRTMNAAIENFVRRCPSQYLWSYNRYKVPAGAAVTPSTSSETV